MRMSSWRDTGPEARGSASPGTVEGAFEEHAAKPAPDGAVGDGEVLELGLAWLLGGLAEVGLSDSGGLAVEIQHQDLDVGVCDDLRELGCREGETLLE